MWAERQCIFTGDCEYCQLVGSDYVITRLWRASEFLTGQMNYHYFHPTFWVQLEVIGPLGDITYFFGNK